MPSDRNTKAGNAGDVVKHPALVAALATVLQEHAPDRVVRYADAFAGFAPYTLPPRGGWCDGIRLLNLREIGAGPASRFVHRWASLFSSPPTAGDRYPGSTAIALETAAGLHREVLISAWDTSEDAYDSLTSAFGSNHNPNPMLPFCCPERREYVSE